MFKVICTKDQNPIPDHQGLDLAKKALTEYTLDPSKNEFNISNDHMILCFRLASIGIINHDEICFIGFEGQENYLRENRTIISYEGMFFDDKDILLELIKHAGVFNKKLN